MGAWGAGSFENDAALDFAGGIESFGDIEAPLTAAGVTEQVEADHSCEIIVAAECIAALQGHPASDLPDDLADRLAGMGKPSADLIDKVRDNFSAVMSRSELGELWAEEGSGDWNRAMTDLMERLNAPVKAANLKRQQGSAKPVYNKSPCSFCGEEMGENAASMFDITVSEDEISSMKLGGWAHLRCLNAALHPNHMIQHWEFDDEMLERQTKRLRDSD